MNSISQNKYNVVNLNMRQLLNIHIIGGDTL